MIESLDLQFTIPEILSLTGLIQCVYILVYMAFRAGGGQRMVLPFVYFLVLGLAFLSSFAERSVGHYAGWYETMQWALWFFGPPLSVLLMIQIARITEAPNFSNFWVLVLVPIAYAFAVVISETLNDDIHNWLVLTGLVAGVISLLAMWAHRAPLGQLRAQTAGRDRYWLILGLVIANLFFLATMLLSLTPGLSQGDADVIRTIWGLGFVYLASTSLFRIYPQAVRLADRQTKTTSLSAEDQQLAEKIEKLINLDKVYHEPAYNRVNLAKELGVSETVVSRIVNQHFGKTLPQLFNERRIADACRLLAETGAPIKTIAEEVGFNSIASFNRAFKESEGVSPGQYRDAYKKSA